jgi:hypothetical protein
MMKKRYNILMLLPVVVPLVFAAPDARMKLAELEPDDSRAKPLPSSAVTLSQAGPNVLVTATIKRWPNVLTVQTEQWYTNDTHVLGFLVGYRGVGKGIAEADQVSWTISNTVTQDISRLRVLQFSDIHVHIDYFKNQKRDRQQSTGE